MGSKIKNKLNRDSFFFRAACAGTIIVFTRRPILNKKLIIKRPRKKYIKNPKKIL